MEHHFTGVYQKSGDWYVAWVEELPGANTQGRTMEEARANLREAIELILNTNRELAARDVSGENVIREPITVQV